jgi:hypothetical protein
MERIAADDYIDRYIHLTNTEKGSHNWRSLRRLLVKGLHYTVKELDEVVQLDKEMNK